MHTVERVSSLRAALDAARQDKKTIAFVPTMGNLHDGHLELVKTAKLQADFVVVSIFVNPTQFAENEDLDNYPSTPEQDARQLAELSVDLLFMPANETMYPGELSRQTVVTVPEIGRRYCGQDRAGHFNGVTTVVSRLFNMVQPDFAVFGKKDYQQLTIIRRMVRDLAYSIEIIGVETVRSKEGLALSSRNGYLSKKELKVAPILQAILQLIAKQLKSDGLAAIDKITAQATEQLIEAGFKPHYLAVCRREDLLPPDNTSDQTNKELVVLTAATLGKTRLLDNIEVDLI